MISWRLKILSLVMIFAEYCAESNNKCVLPQYPKNGIYKVDNDVKLPGEKVDHYTILLYTCDAGYTSSGLKNIVCREDGTWSDDVKCVQVACKTLKSSTHDFTCLLNRNSNGCNGPMLNGTIVNYKCKTYHKLLPNRIIIPLVCINGRWNHNLEKCISKCGGVNVTTNDNEMEDRNGSPWHVGVYKVKTKPFDQVCGGTIITRKLIISAAHCFDNVNRADSYTPKVEDFAVAAGKINRDWENSENYLYKYVVRTEIENIHIPPAYKGHANSMSQDLAVIAVKKLFDFSDFIHPACFDFTDKKFNERILSAGSIGKVVGWGLTNEKAFQKGRFHSLRKASVNITSDKNCSDTYKSYIATDKFCAESTNKNTIVCNEEGGGGLVFNVIEKSHVKWYLFGVASVGLFNRTTCANSTYSMLFTNLHHNNQFIIDTISLYS